jgi:hypothetical protein
LQHNPAGHIWELPQVWPQLPQLLLSKRLRHVPPQQAKQDTPGGHLVSPEMKLQQSESVLQAAPTTLQHTPKLQVWGLPQAWPQLPQLLLSNSWKLNKSRHVPPQQESPFPLQQFESVLQAAPRALQHTPELQVRLWQHGEPLAQLLPFAPQQAPFEQSWLPPQAVLQLPQWLEFEPVSTQVPLQQVRPGQHGEPLPQPFPFAPQQAPLEQPCPPVQEWPHAPQFLVSVAVFTQAPPQLVFPVGQQTPCEQKEPVPQLIPQPPQCWASLWRLTQPPLQQLGAALEQA